MQWVGASQQLPTLSWNLPLTCYLHLRNCFLSLACLRCSLTNLSSSQCQLSKSKRKARRLYQHHQDVSSYSSYFMARDFRRKMLFSSAAKPSPIPTPCSQCPCRPSPVSLSPAFLTNQLDCQYSRETLVSLWAFMESQKCSGWEGPFSDHQIQPSQDHSYTKELTVPTRFWWECQLLEPSQWHNGRLLVSRTKALTLVCLLQNAIMDLRASGSREEFACR